VIKVSTLKKNPNNPRQIRGEKLDLLKKSVTEFDKMMSLRPIIVDENNVVLGGNMRLAAIKALGMKEVPDEWVKRADDLTEAEKREFIIKDNAGFGEWDWDVIANEWTDEPLADWGLDVPGVNDPYEEWQGMPEFNQEDKTAFQSVHIHFKTEDDRNTFAELIKQTITQKTRSLWFPVIEIERYADKQYQ
jgi:hypothetical protein